MMNHDFSDTLGKTAREMETSAVSLILIKDSDNHNLHCTSIDRISKSPPTFYCYNLGKKPE